MNLFLAGDSYAVINVCPSEHGLYTSGTFLASSDPNHEIWTKFFPHEGPYNPKSTSHVTRLQPKLLSNVRGLSKINGVYISHALSTHTSHDGQVHVGPNVEEDRGPGVDLDGAAD